MNIQPSCKFQLFYYFGLLSSVWNVGLIPPRNRTIAQTRLRRPDLTRTESCVFEDFSLPKSPWRILHGSKRTLVLYYKVLIFTSMLICGRNNTSLWAAFTERHPPLSIFSPSAVDLSLRVLRRFQPGAHEA